MTAEARRAIDGAPHLFLRTLEHPAAQEIAASRVCYSFDQAYAEHATFDEVYAEIVERLIEEAARVGELVYAVPGDPLVGEATTRALQAAALERGLKVHIVNAPSFIEPCLALVGFDALDGLQVADGLAIARGHFPALSPDRPALVGQVYSRLVASEVKLTLLAQYPPEHRLRVVHAAGTAEPRVDEVRLAELDHLDRFGHSTSVFIPALEASSSFESLQETIAHLRAPDGCPWDREQTHESLRPHLLEEAYEALQAIDSADSGGLQEELGDLLLQVVLQAQISKEEGDFGMAEVISQINGKLVRRHPHVFGDLEVKDVDEVLHNWEGLKEQERKQAGTAGGALNGVPETLPALAQGWELQSRAARFGFDWRSVEGVLRKVEEELGELRAADSARDQEDEVGDVLFAVVNYARWIGVDPEAALRATNRRFRRRFAHMESSAEAKKHSLRDLSADELDTLWEQAKQDGRTAAE
jgi:tetrapyrrole methylase family protein/MazG family protein